MRIRSLVQLTVLATGMSLVAGCGAADGAGSSPPPLQLRIATSVVDGPCSAPPLTSDDPGSACDREGASTYELGESLGVITPTSVTQTGQSLAVEFDEADTETLGEVTGAAVQQRLAFLLDGEVFSAPTVMQPITSSTLTIGFGTEAQAAQGAKDLGARETS